MKNKKDLIDLVYFAIFIMMVTLLIDICLSNASSDRYFLITTGEYIVKNKSIPTTNIWTMHEDFKIIIQQWLCCVENYLAYNIGQDLGLSIITIIHVVILNILLIKFISLFTYNKRIMIIALCISNYLIHAYINTRPSLVTASILTYELIQLELWNRSPKDKKSNTTLLVNLALISLFHINYHSSLWLMDILFILPYMVPALWELNIHNLKKSLFTQENKRNFSVLVISTVVILVSALINPNGINAIKYLFKSTQIFNIKVVYEISELKAWHTNDVQYIIITLLIVGLAIYIVNSKKDKSLIYITIGTVILSLGHQRNIWMIMFSVTRFIIILLEKRESKHFLVSKNMYKLTTIIGGILLYVFAIILTGKYLYINGSLSTVDDSTSVYKAVEYLDNLTQEEKENLVLYNEFNNGAYLELHGYKAYIDARPEIYQKSINGKADIYQEWADLQNASIDIPYFIDKYSFNTFIVYKGTVLDCYLHYNNNYKQVVDGNEYNVYRLK